MVALAFVNACKAKAPVADKFANDPMPTAPEGYDPARPQLIEIQGENCCAVFFPGAKQMAFLSRLRQRHSHFQIYIYDFDLKNDRRLTFHDGDDQGIAINAKNQQLVYASTTDTNKEEPVYLQSALGKTAPELPSAGGRPMWSMMNFELYRAEKDGTAIDRLTKNPGFDGEATVDPKGQSLVYTTLRQGRSTLMRSDLKGDNAAVLVTGEGHDSQAQYSPDGQDLVFVRYAPDGQSSQIWLLPKGKKKAKAVTEGPGIRWTPSWHSNNNVILFSSNHQDLHNFEIYSINKDATCLQRLTYEVGQDLLPVSWPDGKRLVFTSDRSGAYQLYQLDYKPQSCP